MSHIDEPRSKEIYYLSLEPGSLLCSLGLFSWSTSGPGNPHAPFKACETIPKKLQTSLVTSKPCCQGLNSGKSREDYTTKLGIKETKERGFLSVLKN